VLTLLCRDFCSCRHSCIRRRVRDVRRPNNHDYWATFEFTWNSANLASIARFYADHDLFPVGTYINPKFWTKNTIAELDFWMERGSFQSQNSPALTVTNPVAAHPAATHYWDLSFSTKDAFDLWG